MLNSGCQKNDKDLNSLRINNMVGALSLSLSTGCCCYKVHFVGWFFCGLGKNTMRWFLTPSVYRSGLWIGMTFWEFGHSPTCCTNNWSKIEEKIWHSISIKQYPSEEVKFCCIQMVFKQFISQIKSCMLLLLVIGAFHYLQQGIKFWHVLYKNSFFVSQIKYKSVRPNFQYLQPISWPSKVLCFFSH